LTLTVILIAMLGLAPSILAKQQEETISDPAPSFEDILVSCGGEACSNVEGMQTYTVDFLPHSYIPEQPYNEAIVVLVQEGTLAFRVQTGDVIVDPQGIDGDAASNEIRWLKTTDKSGNPQTVPFGQSPSAIPDDQQPIYNQGDPLTAEECSRGPLVDLCLLNPELFRDEMTFVQLEKGDIVYLPAGSSCFICNVTDTNPADQESGDAPAKVLVWAPGSNFSWYVGSRQDNSLGTQGTSKMQGAGRTLGWMLNPGSRCN